MPRFFDERRRNFFIDKPLQLRYMAWIAGSLTTVSTIVVLSLYFGLWGSILEAFSEEKFSANMETAARMADYEQVRFGASKGIEANPLDWFRQSEKLSARHREVFKEILAETNRTIAIKLAILFFFIAWGSIYLSHKIAGPLYRFKVTLQDIRKGNLKQRIHLRPGDEGKALEHEFNETLIHLDKTASKLKEIVKTHENNPAQLKQALQAELDKLQSSDSQ